MENMLLVAACICGRYREEYGEMIDEMKLHKLMYFAQRESLIQQDAPLFAETFRGWKYGPVLKELRAPYASGKLWEPVDPGAEAKLRPVMDAVFAEFAPMDSFSLTRLTHSELCWKKSRKGIPPADNSDVPIPTEDIRLDALRIRQRREMLKNMV